MKMSENAEDKREEGLTALVPPKVTLRPFPLAWAICARISSLRAMYMSWRCFGLSGTSAEGGGAESTSMPFLGIVSILLIVGRF